MNIHISGTRDGEEWPAVGGIIDLSAHEAETLVAHGYADLVAPKVETATVAAPENAAARTERPKGRSRGRN